MSIQEFHESAGQLMDLVEVFINENVAEKGLTSSECQRMQLINALNELRYSFNGTEAEDLIDDKDSHAKGFFGFDRQTAEALNVCINTATMNSMTIGDDMADLAQSASIAITDAMIDLNEADTERDNQTTTTGNLEILEPHQSESPRRISDNWVVLSLGRKKKGKPCYWNADNQTMTAEIDLATRYNAQAVNKIDHVVRPDSDLCWVNVPLMECGTEWSDLSEVLELWSWENGLKPESVDDMLEQHQGSLTQAQQDWLKQFLSQWFT